MAKKNKELKEIKVAIPKAVSKARINRVLEALTKYDPNPKFSDGQVIINIAADKSDNYIATLGMLIGLTLAKQV
jgi:hypothetical protein